MRSCAGGGEGAACRSSVGGWEEDSAAGLEEGKDTGADLGRSENPHTAVVKEANARVQQAPELSTKT